MGKLTQKKSILYIVATPIGNLDDITLRAIKILEEVDIIYAEDTRRSRNLLNHLGIKTKVISYHQHNEAKRTPEIVDFIGKGNRAALITDGGTPCISDPGSRLVASCIEHQIPVIPIPGPSALLSALCVSGLPIKTFLFVGFLPKQKSLREKELLKFMMQGHTLCLYEAPHRLLGLLELLSKVIGEEHQLFIARELTKLYEEHFHGTIGEALAYFKEKTVRGEFVIIVPPRSIPQNTLTEDELKCKISTLLNKGKGIREISKELAPLGIMKGSEIYELALSIQGKK